MEHQNPYQSPSVDPQLAQTAPAQKLTTKQILFSFEGRIRRSTYWLYYIVLTVVFMVPFVILGGSAGENGEPSSAALIFLLVAMVPLVWMQLAIAVKRWHDRDKSGWWVLISFVPFIGGLWYLIECGFLQGTQGPNRFGNAPL